MNESDDLRLTIRDLSARTGVSLRTIRYYLATGLLPSPGARGKNALYGEEHLLRLQLVRRLVDQRVPLSVIRDRLAALSVAELRALLAEEESHQTRLAEAERAGTPRDYVTTLLEHDRNSPLRERSGTLPAASVRRRALFGSLRDAPAWQQEPGPVRFAVSLPPPQPDDDRLHWRLCPGVELIVEQEVYDHHRQLIEQMIRVVRALLSDIDP